MFSNETFSETFEEELTFFNLNRGTASSIFRGDWIEILQIARN